MIVWGGSSGTILLKNRRTIQPRNQHLERNRHGRRSNTKERAFGGMDRNTNDRLGWNRRQQRSLRKYKYGRAIQPDNQFLEPDNNGRRSWRTARADSGLDRDADDCLGRL